MPKHKDRPFNKKNSVTFKLVHRSQQDPLIADEDAPQFVLQEERRSDRRSHGSDHKKYGVYYDDDYDYMQHLKSVDELDAEELDLVPLPSKTQKEKKKIMLPSSLFDSEVQNPSAMLAGAALPVGPQPDWDPDVVAAMEEDFDFEDPENQLEDDFVIQALGMDGESESSAGGERDSKGQERTGADVDEDWSEDASSRNDSDSDQEKVEKESCFTSYSMTSSVMRRNAGLSLLDQKFETLFEREYGDEREMGPLDVEEIEGRVDPNHSLLMKSLIKEMKQQSDQEFDAKAFISRDHHYEQADDGVDGGESVVQIQVEERALHPDDRFDCESILSTYSNLYHHPKLIYEPKESRVRVNPKTGIPVDSATLTANNLKRLNHQEEKSDVDADAATCASRLSIRDRNETSEERRERKRLVKEHRRERRQEKKGNRMAFRQEDKRLNQELLNVRSNLSAIRLV